MKRSLNANLKNLDPFLDPLRQKESQPERESLLTHTPPRRVDCGLSLHLDVTKILLIISLDPFLVRTILEISRPYFRVV